MSDVIKTVVGVLFLIFFIWLFGAILDADKTIQTADDCRMKGGDVIHAIISGKCEKKSALPDTAAHPSR